MASQQSKILVKHRTEAGWRSGFGQLVWGSRKSVFRANQRAGRWIILKGHHDLARRASLRSNYESLNTATARIGEAVPSRHLSGRPMN